MAPISKLKLTKRSVEALPIPDGQPVRYSDTELRGFNVRVTAAGARIFCLRYRTQDGRRREVAIGRFGEVTAEQARTEATRLLGEVAGGGDPLVAREAEARGTVAELADAFMERYAKPHKRSWKTDEARMRKYVLPSMGTLPLTAVRRADVEALHHTIAVRDGHRNEGRNVVALVSVMFTKAVEWGFLPPEAPNPCRLVKTFPVVKRQRFVAAAELPRLVEAIGQESSIFVRAAFLLDLLTGLRRTELLTLRWPAVDLAKGTALLPMTKAGKPRTVPLNASAIAILRALPRRLGNDAVFPSDSAEDGQMVNVTKAWRRIRERAGVEDLNVHDLRRTVGSWAAGDNESLRMIAGMLGHATTRITEEHYAHLAEDPVRAAFDRHAERVKAAAGGVDLAAVVVFGAGASSQSETPSPATTGAARRTTHGKEN